LAANEAGVDKYTVHQSLNHVDKELKITDMYISRSWDPVDKANRKVLDYVKLTNIDVNEFKGEQYIMKRTKKKV
jgi:hypothetical protein